MIKVYEKLWLIGDAVRSIGDMILERLDVEGVDKAETLKQLAEEILAIANQIGKDK